MSALQIMQEVPPGQAAPFVHASEEDHRDRVIRSAAIGVSFVLLALVSRVIVRKSIVLRWGLEDSAIVLSSVSS